MSEISGGSAENDEMNTPETGGETGQTGSGGTEGLAGGNLESVQLGEGSEVPPAAPAAEITPAPATEVQELSPQQQAEFFARSKQWLADKYGADRIVTASIHRDEASPHLSAFVVPLTQDGRLSAKEFIGGRQKMRDDQTSYAQRVADLGLERGIEGSRAKHQAVKSYYAAIQKEPGHVTITPQAVEPRQYKAQGLAERLGLSKRVETPEAVAERLTAAVRAGYAPALQAAAGARQERQKAKQAQDTAQDLRERLKPVLDALGPLNEANRAKVAAIIKAVGEKALSQQREEQRQKAAQRQQERGRDRGGYSR